MVLCVERKGTLPMSPSLESNPEFDPTTTTLEAWILDELGYGHLKYTRFRGKTIAFSGNHFLEDYGDSPHREKTYNRLLNFSQMSHGDERYEATREYIDLMLRKHLHIDEQRSGEEVSEGLY
jgi:hypothetical protein